MFSLSLSRPSSARPSLFRRLAKLATGALLAASVLLLPLEGTALAKPKVHVVYSGQRLGSIAKRYNVTVAELCAANGIKQSDPIRPGQKLVIPGTDDGSDEEKSKAKKDDKSDESAKADKPQKPSGKTRLHVVAKGHTLSAIAGRYAVTISAIENANDISRKQALTVGDTLVIPHKTDRDGSYARKERLRGKFDDDLKDKDDDDDKSSKESKKSGEKSWEKYVKPAWRRGYIKIRRYGRSWEGYVIGPSGQVLGHASNKINFVMGARDDGPRIDPKLIRLISSISDKFGGRELRIVSGYRTKSFVAASQHKAGKALDFSIPGMPNEALRDYLRTLNGVGVGYYPNSSFVHLDVRGYNSYWIDYAGPGEAPRKRKGSSKKSKGAKKDAAAPEEDEDDDEHDHDHGDDAPDEGGSEEEGTEEEPLEDDGPSGETEPPGDDAADAEK